MAAETTPTEKATDHLPEPLRTRIAAEVPLESIWAAVAFDLDPHGRYMEGYLTVTDSRLGEHIRCDGEWKSRWMDLSGFGEAKIVEGLGMGLLRLLSDDKSLEEFRFTMRHAKDMARLHRQLERRLEGKEGEAEPIEEARRPDEKKLRCEKCGRVMPAWAEFCPACTVRRKILFRLLDYVKPYRTRIIGGFFLALTILGFQLLQPRLMKTMVDTGLGGATSKPDFNVFLLLLCLWGVLLMLSAAGEALQSRILAVLGARVARDLRNAVYSHMHKLSLSFFARKRTGSLVTRVTSDTDRMYDFVAFTMLEVIMAGLTIAGVIACMLWMHWKLALFTLLPVPLMILFTIFFHRRLHKVFGRIWHRWSQMTSVVAGALPGVRVIKAFGQEEREIDRFEFKSGQVFSEEMSLIGVWTFFGPVMRFCTLVGILVIWGLGGWWICTTHDDPNPAMSLGTLWAFNSFMQMFFRPIHQIAHMDRTLNRAATSAQRLFEVLDTEPAIFSQPEARHPKEILGRIELKNVSFSYDGIRRVLRNIDLTIEPGQLVGLAGPSGGGKTTMINLICRFYDVLEGTILIDGIDVRDYKVEELRRKIGVVLQDPFLFHGTVAENIAYGKPEATLDEIIEASRAANAHDFITAFPDGYDTMVGERGHDLSGGERQRISIARAILDNPAVLILDEATSSVDTETEQLIQEALAHLIANRTTIAIAHRLSTLRRADRLVILEKGAIVEEGTHQQLATKEGGLYAKLLRMQAELHAVMAEVSRSGAHGGSTAGAHSSPGHRRSR